VQGYSLYLAAGRLHFAVRSRSGLRKIDVPLERSGEQAAAARLRADGMMSLVLNDSASAPARASSEVGGLIASMPGDGLDVGRDEGGAVGPYTAPNPFTGALRSVVVELEAR
jgi:hypothetical protein